MCYGKCYRPAIDRIVVMCSAEDMPVLLIRLPTIKRTAIVTIQRFLELSDCMNELIPMRREAASALNVCSKVMSTAVREKF